MNLSAKRTLPVGDWQAHGLCRDRKDDLFFPDGETSPAAIAQINEAKRICRRCPVMPDCQDWALENGESDGVWGGLSEADRRSIHRQAARTGGPVQEIAPSPPARYATIAGALAARSNVVDGHSMWAGSPHFTIDGVRHTARRAAFQELHGRPPVGQVNNTCDRTGCITHLDDMQIRERCGTPAGYRKHRKNGEDPCRRCKDANAAADRRLRYTGTTKALVA